MVNLGQCLTLVDKKREALNVFFSLLSPPFFSLCSQIQETMNKVLVITVLVALFALSKSILKGQNQQQKSSSME